MSDTGSNNPYDPPSDGGSGSTPPPPPPPPPPQWGSNPPGATGQPGQPGDSGGWTGGQLGGQQYGQQPGGQQYGQPYGQPAGGPPPNYLVWSILTTLFCCLPLGVVSIVYAAQVNSKYAGGDVAGAQESSAKAKRFAIWSVVVGLVVAAIYIVGAVLLAVSSGSST